MRGFMWSVVYIFSIGEVFSNVSCYDDGDSVVGGGRGNY